MAGRVNDRPHVAVRVHAVRTERSGSPAVQGLPCGESRKSVRLPPGECPRSSPRRVRLGRRQIIVNPENNAVKSGGVGFGRGERQAG